MSKYNKILLSGFIDLGPIGRHGLSFISTLTQDKRNIIYIDSDYLLKDSKRILRDFFPEHYKSFIFTDKNTKNEKFDFLIYFSFLLGCPDSENWFYKALEKDCKIKICYPVFDGTVPPLEWIDEINANFDLCMSPSDYVAHNLKRNGVNIDCMGLECVVFMDELIAMKPKQTNNNMFRIGCISGFERRKNLEFLVRSFAETFTKDDNIELYIHSVGRDNCILSYSDFEELVIQLNKTCNITLHKKFISHKELMNLWKTFDAYVIPQTNSGYYTTPVEALAIGIPVILSDIPVHRELAAKIEAENNLFLVPHNELIPEYHLAFDYRNIGASFASTTKEYVKVFRQVKEKLGYLNNIDMVVKRKKYANLFSSKYLSNKHNIIFNPSNVAVSNNTHISENTLYISQNLANKYLSLNIIDSITKQEDESFIIKSYPEENSREFKQLELCARTSQQIYLMQKRNKEKDVINTKTKKYIDKLKNLDKKYNISNIIPLPYHITKALAILKYWKSCILRKGIL